uniref:Uncharacterized protein n=1 Tax=Bosea sp. NBC_00436 TaxID=2969620 RepID=A0A9E7ZVK1_9HYPH
MLAASSAAPGPAIAADWTERERHTLARLRAEYKAAREENRKLWSRLAPEGRLPECLKLSPSESRLLASLLVNGALRTEALLYGMCPDLPEAELPAIKSVGVVVYHLRARLRPYGIAISTPRCGDGYFMSPLNRVKLGKLIRAEVEATGRPITDFVEFSLAVPAS